MTYLQPQPFIAVQQFDLAAPFSST